MIPAHASLPVSEIERMLVSAGRWILRIKGDARARVAREYDESLEDEAPRKKAR